MSMWTTKKSKSKSNGSSSGSGILPFPIITITFLLLSTSSIISGGEAFSIHVSPSRCHRTRARARTPTRTPARIRGQSNEFVKSSQPLYSYGKGNDEADTDTDTDMDEDTAIGTDTKPKDDVNASTSTSTSTRNNDDDNEKSLPQKIDEFMDPIISAPSFGTFLFWTPFVANPTLRQRASNFIATNVPGGEQSILPIVSFTVVSFVTYVLYQDRIDTIDLARGRTAYALQRLKDARSSQLGGGSGRSIGSRSNSSGSNDSGSGSVMMDGEEYKAAMELYEQSLTEELKARYILPGVKVPGVDWDPADREEDRAAARQFLKMEITEQGTLNRL